MIQTFINKQEENIYIIFFSPPDNVVLATQIGKKDLWFSWSRRAPRATLLDGHTSVSA